VLGFLVRIEICFGPVSKYRHPNESDGVKLDSRWFHNKNMFLCLQSGVYSSIPHIAKVFAALASGHIADRLLLKCSTTVVRKILTSVGM